VSALEISAYKIQHVKGKVRKDESINELEDKFNFSADDNVNGDGEPKSLMRLKIFQNAWVPNDKYWGDYAVGLYDLSELIDEDAVRNIVIKDIKDLLSTWEV
jgi:hypothetical protein